LVVWDGESLDKSGGTEETMGEALHQGVPIIWVDARSPHGWRFIHEDNQDQLNSLSRIAATAPADDDPLKRLRALVENKIKHKTYATSPFQVRDVSDG
jgi:hypothetical protein